MTQTLPPNKPKITETMLDAGGQYVTIRYPQSQRFRQITLKMAEIHMAAPGLFTREQLRKMHRITGEIRDLMELEIN